MHRGIFHLGGANLRAKSWAALYKFGNWCFEVEDKKLCGFYASLPRERINKIDF